MESVKGLEKLLKTLEKLPKELDTEVDVIAEANAKEIEAEAKRLAPKDTGFLARSIYTNKVAPKTYRVSSYASYAPFVEYGKPIGTGPNGGPKPFLFPAFRNGVKRFRKDLEAFLDFKIEKI
jgi:HK97 gp10 family phage protein